MQWLMPVILVTQESKIKNSAKAKFSKTPGLPMIGHGGMHLSSQLGQDTHIGGSWFRPAWA
jgi:hypothetical protein